MQQNPDLVNNLMSSLGTGGAGAQNPQGSEQQPQGPPNS